MAKKGKISKAVGITLIIVGTLAIIFAGLSYLIYKNLADWGGSLTIEMFSNFVNIMLLLGAGLILKTGGWVIVKR